MLVTFRRKASLPTHMQHDYSKTSDIQKSKPLMIACGGHLHTSDTTPSPALTSAVVGSNRQDKTGANACFVWCVSVCVSGKWCTRISSGIRSFQ